MAKAHSQKHLTQHEINPLAQVLLTEFHRR